MSESPFSAAVVVVIKLVITPHTFDFICEQNNLKQGEPTSLKAGSMHGNSARGPGRNWETVWAIIVSGQTLKDTMQLLMKHNFGSTSSNRPKAITRTPAFCQNCLYACAQQTWPSPWQFSAQLKTREHLAIHPWLETVFGFRPICDFLFFSNLEILALLWRSGHL